MRVGRTVEALNRRLSAELRRQYPLVGNQSLTDSYDKLTLPEHVQGHLGASPFLEALPQYASYHPDGLAHLLVDPSVPTSLHPFIEFMQKHGSKAGFFAPYVHQTSSLLAYAKGADVVVSTGTGSGKTECFLWPIAAHLHQTATRINQRKQDGEIFDDPSHRGMKAIVLYPMNALVSDQLKRLRKVLGDTSVAEDLASGAMVQGGHDRPFQFGQYTGRTKSHGIYAKGGSGGGSIRPHVGKNHSRFNRYVQIEEHSSLGVASPQSLYFDLDRLGMIPAKGKEHEAHGRSYWSLKAFLDQEIRPPSGSGRRRARLVTQHGDRELLFRHEMHKTGYYDYTYSDKGVKRPIITDEVDGGGTPDVLVTNYSMLEYMLKRPLEHGMFVETRNWLEEHEENRLLLVLDEAHLYSGSLGTELGFLIRRLLAELHIADQPKKIQFILTSASLGKDPQAKWKFTRGLTGRSHERDSMDVPTDPERLREFWSDLAQPDRSTLFVQGTRRDFGPQPDLVTLREELQGIELDLNSLDEHHLTKGASEEENFLALQASTLFRFFYGTLNDGPKDADALAVQLFAPLDDMDRVTATSDERNQLDALLNYLASKRLNGRPLIGIRAHLFYRGLPTLFHHLSSDTLLTRHSSHGGPSYPLRGCRRCGAPVITFWIPHDRTEALRASLLDRSTNWEEWLHPRSILNSDRFEAYLYDRLDPNGKPCLEVQGRTVVHDRPPHLWINTLTYTARTHKPRDDELGQWKPAILPAASETELMVELANPVKEDILDRSMQDDNCVHQHSFTSVSCPQCNTDHSKRQSNQFTDYMTRGDDAFSKLIATLLGVQDAVPEKSHLPNQGRKVMVFSDSRSRAAKFAGAVQNRSNYDELRNLLLQMLTSDIGTTKRLKQQGLTEHFYAYFLLFCARKNIEPFESNPDRWTSPADVFRRHRGGLLGAFVYRWREVDRAAYIDALGQQVVDKLEAEDTVQEFGQAMWNFWLALRFKQGGLFEGTESQVKRRVKKHFLHKLLGGLHTTDGEELTVHDKETLLGLALGGHFEGMDAPEIEGILATDWSEMATVTREEDGQKINDIISDILSYLEGGDVSVKNPKWLETPVLKRLQGKLQILHAEHHRVELKKASEHRDKHVFFARFEHEVVLMEHLQNLATQFCDIIAQPPMFGTDEFHLVNNAMSDFVNYRMSRSGTPWAFETLLSDLLASKDFSLSGLGLGRLVLTKRALNSLKEKLGTALGIDPSDVEEHGVGPFSIPNATERNEKLQWVLDEFVHWANRGSYSKADRDAGKASGGGGRIVNFEWRAIESHPSVYHTSDQHGISFADMRKALARFYEAKFGVNIATDQGYNPAISEALLDLCSEKNSDPSSGDRRLLLKQAVRIQPVPSSQVTLLFGCLQCGHVMVKSEPHGEQVCENCGSVDNVVPYDERHPLLRQRVHDPWRSPATAAMDDQDHSLRILRAEEHTAQINTLRDDDQMYTTAEEFELLFQDVPFTIPEGRGWVKAQAPIDVLSCTTTMEVGIDIGSLTCVALRTVPRAQANYQQRVGRAGRGAAEVCIAMSWCDNLPYAQSHFSNPGGLIEHPEKAPVMYLNNPTILKRHLNAAIFQAFFKRFKYNLPTRSFPDLQSTTMFDANANLMESMGTSESFFQADEGDDIHRFTLDRFCAWLGLPLEDEEDPKPDPDGGLSGYDTWAEIRAQVLGIIPSDMTSTHGGEPVSPDEVLDNAVQDLIGDLRKASQSKEVDEDG